MNGQRLIWGMPIEGGGWRVVASSFRALSPEQENDLVTQTSVGKLDERNFNDGDGYGYFGEFGADGNAWAVLAHFYRSPKAVFTGQYFVQRDICLAPLADFKHFGY